MNKETKEEWFLSATDIPELPPEILVIILSNINDIKTLHAASVVSKLWYELTKSHINQINFALAGGDFHYLLLTPAQELLVWGSNRYGQLGLGELKENTVYKPQVVDLKAHGIDSVKKIYAYADHSFLLTYSGKLFAWGNNYKCQLGLGHKAERVVWTPKEVDLKSYGIDSVKDIFTGNYHTLLLTKSNRLYAWGSNQYGQLGLNMKIIKQTFPTAIFTDKHFINNIKNIYAGKLHTFLLTESNELYAWGNNNKSQLGVGFGTIRVTYSPVVVDLKTVGINNIQQIFVGKNHTFLLTRSNKVYAWGDNSSLQCGINNRCYEIVIPQLVDFNKFGIESIQCIYPGELQTYLLTESGELFAWGRNQNGLLGLRKSELKAITKRNSSKCIATPLAIGLKRYRLDKINCICTGACNTVLLTNSGKVLAWGSNQYSYVNMWASQYPPNKIFNVPQPMKRFHAGMFESSSNPKVPAIEEQKIEEQSIDKSRCKLS